MARGFASSLQSIRQGGTAPGNTLAGQIRAIRQKRQQARAEQEQNLREFMLDRQKAESEARRRAVKSQTDMDEMKRQRKERIDKVMFGFTQGAATLSENPAKLKQYLAERPRLSKMAGLDPRNPDIKRIESLRDNFRARVKGDVPEQQGEDKQTMLVQGGSPQAQQLEEQWGVNIPRGETAEVEFTGDRVTNVNRFGAQQEQPRHTPGQKESQELQAEVLQKNIQSGLEVDKRIDQLDALESSLLAKDVGGFKTGFLGELRQLMSQAADLSGIDPQELNLGDASTSEIIDSVSGRLAVDMASELSRPTRLSLKLIRRSLPNLSKTVQGNLILSKLLKLRNYRTRGLGKVSEAFRTKSEDGITLDSQATVDVAGQTLSLEPGTTYTEAVNKMDEQMQTLDDQVRQYIQNAASDKYSQAKVAPTGADGETIDAGAMKEGNTYLMPDGRLIRFKGISPDGKIQGELLDELKMGKGDNEDG